MNNIRTLEGHTPKIHESAFIDPSAVIIGKVTIGVKSSIWCNTVVRGDVSYIQIGDNTNIQDLTMLHVTHYYPNRSKEVPLIIGNNVTVGHSCCLHACTLEDNTFIGMGSIILDNAVIEKHAFLGANSFVPQGKCLKGGYLYFGNPVKQIRKLTDAEIEHIAYSAEHYVDVASKYL